LNFKIGHLYSRIVACCGFSSISQFEFLSDGFVGVGVAEIVAATSIASHGRMSRTASMRLPGATSQNQELDSFKGSRCISSDQANSVQQLRQLFSLNVIFYQKMDGVCSLRKSVNKQSDPNSFQEEANSNNEQEWQSDSQVAGKLALSCDSCDNRLPSKVSKKGSKGCSWCSVDYRHYKKLLQLK